MSDHYSASEHVSSVLVDYLPEMYNVLNFVNSLQTGSGEGFFIDSELAGELSHLMGRLNGDIAAFYVNSALSAPYESVEDGYDD